MVDAIALRDTGGPKDRLADIAGTIATAGPASNEELTTYAELARQAAHGPAQDPAWVAAWIGATGADALVVTLRVSGRPVLALALEIRREGAFRTARFMGGKHANGNFPMADRAWLDTAGTAEIEAVVGAIARARPDIDLVAFDRLSADFDGLPNPLLRLPSTPSPNVALAVDLTGGFEAVLGRTSGKKKAKRHRSQERKYEAVGGARRVIARSQAETDAMLDAFFAMKAQRFHAMGITDVFASAEVQAFFRQLFAEALGSSRPPFLLHGLEVGGKYRAVTGSSRAGNRFICEFGAIADDDLGHISPGEYLFFDNIAEACEQGFAIYDFSVGDEPYKRQWCDVELRHHDVLVPLTAKGKALALSLKAAARAKAFVKNSPGLWQFVKRARAGLRGGD